ncbi:MAG: radical SAM protein [Mariprofundaceae bacterium]|nr:radical SAM protein [Mariprofundaceae bacterium]
MLSVSNHDRDVVDLTYVYPVISRRAGGVSLGINLNPNNACNWQCVYCQVPNLTRGVAPKVDLTLLEQELDGFLQQLLLGDYMLKHVPADCRTLQDIAISGNGEPTTCPHFSAVVALLLKMMDKYHLNIPLRLITNGSSVHKADVLQGLQWMGQHGGEVWFKVDAIGEQDSLAINGVSLSAAWQQQQLHITAKACPTWLQTCVLDMQGQQGQWAANYLAWLNGVLADHIQLEGVLLYGLARPSLQAGGAQLKSADSTFFQTFAKQIEALGLLVKVS